MLPHYLATADKDTYFITFPPCKIHTELEFKCRYYIFPPKNCRLARNAFFFLKQAWKTMLQSFFCVPFCNVRKRVQDFFCNVLVLLQSLKLSISVTLFFFSGHVKVLWVKVEKYHLVEPFFSILVIIHTGMEIQFCVHWFIHSFLSLGKIFFEL